jgi:hypothetical protein
MRGAIALAILAWGATASARPTEVVATVGILSPTPSTYRYNAEALGYDRRGFRHVYEAEIALMQSFSWWLSVGPVARFYYGDLSSPYDGVPSIATYAGSLGARTEVDLFPRPRLFLWMDPSVGVGKIGSNSVALWGVRGGVGIGSVRSATALRFRFGWGSAPTFQPVTATSGDFNFGGFMFQLDGVLRVAR